MKSNLKIKVLKKQQEAIEEEHFDYFGIPFTE